MDPIDIVLCGRYLIQDTSEHISVDGINIHIKPSQAKYFLRIFQDIKRNHITAENIRDHYSAFELSDDCGYSDCSLDYDDSEIDACVYNVDLEVTFAPDDVTPILQATARVEYYFIEYDEDGDVTNGGDYDEADEFFFDITEAFNLKVKEWARAMSSGATVRFKVTQ